jgi:enamine deaminase RidA (YjgF/YER057c/UK114 family)
MTHIAGAGGAGYRRALRCYNQPMSIKKRLAELGITLPELVQPVGNYVPYKVLYLAYQANIVDLFRDGPVACGMLYISGMIPLQDGKPFAQGKLGADVNLEDGVTCARICTLNALSWANHALGGDLDRIIEVVQVRGHVASTADFYDQAKVINGCSDLLVEIFGEAGKHTRVVVGCPALPLNVPVEIDFVFSLR